jgi:putative intracellular protease/amidase
LRIQAKAVAFVKAFFDEVKPVAAICTKGGGQQALFYVLAELPDDLP